VLAFLFLGLPGLAGKGIKARDRKRLRLKGHQAKKEYTMLKHKKSWLLVGAFCVVLVSMQSCAPAALREKEEFGPQDLRMAARLNEEALLYHRQGKYAEAEPL